MADFLLSPDAAHTAKSSAMLPTHASQVIIQQSLRHNFCNKSPRSCRPVKNAFAMPGRVSLYCLGPVVYAVSFLGVANGRFKLVDAESSISVAGLLMVLAALTVASAIIWVPYMNWALNYAESKLRGQVRRYLIPFWSSIALGTAVAGVVARQFQTSGMTFEASLTLFGYLVVGAACIGAVLCLYIYGGTIALRTYERGATQVPWKINHAETR